MIIDYVGPFYVKLFQLGYHAYQELPADLLMALGGLGLSVCGGAYCASISAIEAVRMSGWERTKSALLDVYTDVCAIYAAYSADTNADDDSIRHVTRLSANDLLTRKLAVMAMAVNDPEKLSAALGGLYTSWLAVQAVLRIEFAKTITLGVSIATMATPYLQKVGSAAALDTDPGPDSNPEPQPEPEPGQSPNPSPNPHKVGVPVLVHVMPPAYHHWIPMLIANTARSVGVAVAWKMQVSRAGRDPPLPRHTLHTLHTLTLCTLCTGSTLYTLCFSTPSVPLSFCAPLRHLHAISAPRQEVVSAVHLAMLGGLLFSRSMLRWARRQGHVASAPEDTVLDEVACLASQACECNPPATPRVYLATPRVPGGGLRSCGGGFLLPVGVGLRASLPTEPPLLPARLGRVVHPMDHHLHGSSGVSVSGVT